jgi:hypothetical protein
VSLLEAGVTGAAGDAISTPLASSSSFSEDLFVSD